MTVVGSYEFNLEDEYDPVGLPFPTWILAIIIIVTVLLAGIGVFVARRR